MVVASTQYSKVDNYHYIVVFQKRGFSNALFKTEYSIINVEDLNVFEDGTVVTPALLKEAGLVKKELDGIKVLGEGKLEKEINCTS